MISSVLFTGDAGGLNYIGENLTDENKGTVKFCCSCTDKDISRAENDLAPIRRGGTKDYKSLTPVPFEKDYIFRWTNAVIAEYSNVDSMRS